MFAIGIGGLAAGAASATVLTLQVAGAGSVVASAAPEADALTCSNRYARGPAIRCSAERVAGTVITITASRAPDHWTGPCEAVKTGLMCTFTMPNAPTEVGTVFPNPLGGDLDCADPDYGYTCSTDCSVDNLRGDGHQYWSAGGEKKCAAAFRSGMMSIGKGKIHSYTLGDSTGVLVPRMSVIGGRAGPSGHPWQARAGRS